MEKKQKLKSGDKPDIIRRYDGTVTVLKWREPPIIDPTNLIVGPSMIELELGRPYSADFNTPKISTLVTGVLQDLGYSHEVQETLNEYHRSWVTKDALLSSTLGYSRQEYPKVFDDCILAEVIDQLIKEFTPANKIRSWTAEKGLNSLSSLSTSSGLPHLEVKSISKKEAWQIDKPWILEKHKAVRQGRPYAFYDCAAFARSHISTKDVNKVRLVWAAPLDIISLECKYSSPITQAIRNQEIGLNIAYGAETTLGGCFWLYKQLEKADRLYNGTNKIVLDYSSFDQTIPPWLIRIAFSILENTIHQTEMEDENGNIIKTSPIEIKREWSAIKKYFINTPIRMTDGRRFMKTGGVPSGSCFTNIIDGICNLIAIRYSMKATTGQFPIFDIVMGDDSVTAIPKSLSFNFEYFKTVLKVKFGLLAHPKKSIYTDRNDHVKFLGYYNVRGQPIRAVQEMINSLIFPETTVDDTWELAQARAVGVGIASAGCSEKIMHMCEGILQRIARKGHPMDTLSPYAIRKTGRQMGWMINNIYVYGTEIVVPNNQCAVRSIAVPLTRCPKTLKNVDLVRR